MSYRTTFLTLTLCILFSLLISHSIIHCARTPSPSQISAANRDESVALVDWDDLFLEANEEVEEESPAENLLPVVPQPDRSQDAVFEWKDEENGNQQAPVSSGSTKTLISVHHDSSAPLAFSASSTAQSQKQNQQRDTEVLQDDELASFITEDDIDSFRDFIESTEPVISLSDIPKKSFPLILVLIALILGTGSICLSVVVCCTLCGIVEVKKPFDHKGAMEVDPVRDVDSLPMF